MYGWIQHTVFKEKKYGCRRCSHLLDFKRLFSLCVYAICLLFLFVIYRFEISGRLIRDDIKNSWDH